MVVVAFAISENLPIVASLTHVVLLGKRGYLLYTLLLIANKKPVKRSEKPF